MAVERDNGKVSVIHHEALQEAKRAHRPYRDVYSDASGKPTAREYEMPEEKGWIREDFR